VLCTFPLGIRVFTIDMTPRIPMLKILTFCYFLPIIIFNIQLRGKQHHCNNEKAAKLRNICSDTFETFARGAEHRNIFLAFRYNSKS